MSANAQLDAACSTFDINSTTVPLIDLLNELSKDLARSQELRLTIGNAEPSVWPHLRRLWTDIASVHQQSDADSNTQTLQTLCLSLSRFTRNLSAAVPSNQTQAFDNEPAIRILLHHYTSFYVLEDENSLPVTRMLVQTLSNLVTANERLAKRIWNEYMSLPAEDLVLIRLLSVPDDSTVLSTLVFILNCVHSSREQLELLTRTRNGSRLSISLLDQVAAHFSQEDSSDGGRAFEIGYTIVTHLIEQGLVPDLYRRIAVEEEIVSPHQTTLLKLLDSYLHSAGHGPLMAYHRALCDMSISCFFTQSLYAQRSIRRALGIDTDLKASTGTVVPKPDTTQKASTSGARTLNSDASVSATASLQEVDLLLPKICEALVLTTQCLISLTLWAEAGAGGVAAQSPSIGKEDPLRTTDGTQSAGTLKGYVGNIASANGVGFVETLVETLQLFDLFLPRITFGKTSPSPVLAGGDPARSSAAPLLAAHDDTLADHVANPSAAKTLSVDPKGFLYLKRDLIRLLGILTYHSKQIQDRIRVCGGITVVLNCCVVDERNPYLREHALFTLRNLLNGNPENQALVDEIQPIREWDMNGELKGRPKI